MPLHLTNISKSFGAVKALQNIDFDLADGEIHAVCGENGAGKSTLMNLLSGNLQPDSGEIQLNNKVVQFKNQTHATVCGIAIVYQHLSLFENQNIAENIFVDQFPTTRLGLIDYKKLYSETALLLQKLNFDPTLRPQTRVSELSAGQKQLVEIAKALSKKPAILILDEPTASITEDDVIVLFNIIRQLKATGTSIIYISHRIEEIFTLAERVTVLKDGQKVGVYPTVNLSKQALIALMVGRALPSTTNQRTKTEIVALKVERLGNTYIKDISFQLFRGEILALAGLVGAGRTEIAKTIFGALKKEEGEIFLNNTAIQINSPADAIRNQIAYVPEERKTLGLFQEMSIAENISSIFFTSNQPFFHDAAKTSRIASDYRKKLNINSASISQKVAQLSGGNQQKVVLAKWLSSNPEVLIVDEPTHGIDVGAKFEIYQLLKKLAAEGKAILLISSELPEILAISDRVLVIKNGRIAKELTTAQTSEEEILKWAM